MCKHLSAILITAGLTSTIAAGAFPLSLTCAELFATHELVQIGSVRIQTHFTREGPNGAGSSGMDSLSQPAVWKETGLVFGYSSSRDALDFFNIQTGVLDRSATLRPRGENSRYHDGAGPVMGAYINPRGDRFFALGYQPVLYSASIADIYAGKALEPLVDFRKEGLDFEGVHIDKYRISDDGQRVLIVADNRFSDEKAMPIRVTGVFDVAIKKWLMFTKISRKEGREKIQTQMSDDGSSLLSRTTVPDDLHSAIFAFRNYLDYEPHGIDTRKDFSKVIVNLDSMEPTLVVYPEGSNDVFNTSTSMKLSRDGKVLHTWYDGATVGIEAATGHFTYRFESDGYDHYPVGFAPDETAIFIHSSPMDSGPTLTARDLTREGAPEIKNFRLPVDTHGLRMSVKGRWLVVKENDILKIFEFREPNAATP